jgi:hypothetical protein
MIKNILIAFGLTLGLLISCNKPDNFIIGTDVEKIVSNASKNGLTVEANERLGLLIYDSIKKNTIGKTLPDMLVRDLSHQKLNLIDELKKEHNDFILVSSDIYCGFGMDCILNIFPESLKKFRAQNEDIKAFCLLKRTAADNGDSVRFNKTINELIPLYNSIYIIEEKEVSKLNMHVNPSRLYVTKDMVVKNITFGITMTGDLYEEIEQNAK